MKYCQKCGKELMDEAIICPGCGCAVAAEAYRMQRYAEENGGLATAAIIFAFISPLVGIILGIIGISKYTVAEYKQRSINAIAISLAVFFVCLGILIFVSSAGY